MKLISYDLGTGGVKASLYDGALHTLAKSFIEYETVYPGPDMHEQRPEDWWTGVVHSTRVLLERSGTAPSEIACVALSGHSLVSVPVDARNRVLQAQVPIWSDTRAQAEAAAFFTRIPERDWYMATGNGFPAPCYSIFKLMWLKAHEPELFARVHRVLGSKDYINFRLTGQIATDWSYASGTGAYDLKAGRMRPDFLEAAGLPADLFPTPDAPHRIVGTVTGEAARETGLCAGTPVACGGVDNACMALGAVGPVPGRVYTSLGSSSWIPVNSAQPVLDAEKRPYVFAHIQEGLFTSAFSIFAGGSSLRWARETLCRDIADDGRAYQIMDGWAEQVPLGSNGIFFNPSLAGGTSQDKSIHIRGAFVGLHLGTTREDMIRAVMEGITLNLRLSLEALGAHTALSGPLLICGGGSRSPFWMQMFADVFGREIVKSNIDQDAASIGAAAIAARAVGLWRDYGGIDGLHQIERRCAPDPDRAARYEALFPVFRHICGVAADLGDAMYAASCGEPNTRKG